MCVDFELPAKHHSIYINLSDNLLHILYYRNSWMRHTKKGQLFSLLVRLCTLDIRILTALAGAVNGLHITRHVTSESRRPRTKCDRTKCVQGTSHKESAFYLQISPTRRKPIRRTANNINRNNNNKMIKHQNHKKKWKGTKKKIRKLSVTFKAHNWLRNQIINILCSFGFFFLVWFAKTLTVWG